MATSDLPALLSLRPATLDDPWRWLVAGWNDTWRNPYLSLGYGLAFVVGGLALAALLWALGLESLLPVLAAGFTLLGPAFAAGLYEMSRKYAAGEEATWRDALVLQLPRPAQIAFLSFALMFLFLAWLRLATLLYALFASGSYMPITEFVPFVLATPSGLAMLVVGTLVGGAIALVAFAISALSIPIVLQHDVDAVSAMLLSVRALLQHPGPMLLWAWLIALLTAFGLGTLFLGLIVVFPVVGHATWHAYRAMVAVAD